MAIGWECRECRAGPSSTERRNGKRQNRSSQRLGPLMPQMRETRPRWTQLGGCRGVGSIDRRNRWRSQFSARQPGLFRAVCNVRSLHTAPAPPSAMQILRMSCRAGRVMCQAARHSAGGLPPPAAPRLRAGLFGRAAAPKHDGDLIGKCAAGRQDENIYNVM